MSGASVRTRCLHAAVAVLVAGWSLLFATYAAQGAAKPVRRIVSLAPSVTETLYALGLGKRVVGVTRYCDYPPAARKLPRIGGYDDTNYEAIASLKPDLVILSQEQDKQSALIRKLGIETLQVNMMTYSGVPESITRIAKRCGVPERARRFVTDFRRRTEKVRTAVKGLPRPKVLICIDRPVGSGTLKEIWLAANGGLFHEMLTIAGGRNAYGNAVVAAPRLSAEGVARLNPDIIVDVVPYLKQRKLSPKAVIAEWNAVSATNAVKHKRVHVLGEEYDARPGPQCVRVLEDLARVVHPEAKWK